MDVNRPVVLAAIIGAHGVGGEVRLKLFAQSEAGFGAYKSFNGGTLTLKSLRQGSNGAIARFAEIADRNAAEARRGTELTVNRSELPALDDGEYYHADLIGLPAVSTTGEGLGVIVAVDNFGAGDILEIERPDKKRFMVPMCSEAISEWGKQVVVDDAFVER